MTDTTTPAEATISFAALLLGSLFYAAINHGGPFVAVAIITAVLYCAVWGIGVASQQRHCTPQEKPNVGRAALFALLAAFITGGLLCFGAWYAVKCNEVTNPCLRGLSLFSIGFHLFHTTGRWQAFALIFPFALLTSWGLTWLSLYLSNRNACKPTNKVKSLQS